MEIITEIGEIPLQPGQTPCELRYCREEVDANGMIVEIEVPDPWLATTAGCAGWEPVVDPSLCPMIHDENGAFVPADCSGQAAILPVSIPNDKS